MKNRATEESKYARAAAKWVAEKMNLNVDLLYGVNFAIVVGGYCPTCGYEDPGLSFYYDGKPMEYVPSITPGEFIEECVALLED